MVEHLRMGCRLAYLTEVLKVLGRFQPKVTTGFEEKGQKPLQMEFAATLAIFHHFLPKKWPILNFPRGTSSHTFSVLRKISNKNNEGI